MKKIIALLLCLLMLASLAACGDNDVTTGCSEPSQTESTQETTPSQEAEEPEEPEVSEPVESQPEETTGPAFDTSWASNEFEALLPELPFAGWEVTKQTDTTYKMQVGGLRTNTSTGAEEDAADKLALISYLESLPAYGFTVEETGEGYMWLVTDANGNTAEFMCGDGYCFLEIKKAAA